MHVLNRDIVQLLRSIAAAYILTNVNRFRIVAYEKAADTVEHLDQELYDLWENKGLEGISTVNGIGPTISQHLDEYFRNPHNSYLQQAFALVPSTVYQLMKAPGIGPKKAFRIVKEFNLINNEKIFDDVLALAKKHKIAVLEGFGEKSEQDIVDAIGVYLSRAQHEERMALPKAFGIAMHIIDYMKQCAAVDHIETLGSLRRTVATIGDIDLAVIAKYESNKKILDHFVEYPRKNTIEGKGVNKAALITKAGKRIDLRIIDKARYGSMLQYFTGSKAHNIKLREYALKKGYSLNEFGIKNVDSGKIKEFSQEKDFYSFLGLDYIPPELREGSDEIKKAALHKLPSLVTGQNIKGDLHMHSDFPIEPSHDLGADSMKKIIMHALQMGYAYIAFSEHNPSAGNHSPKQITALIKKKKEVLLKMQKKNSNIKIFNALEVDILPNGDLPLSHEALMLLDFAIISIHSSFTQSRHQMTQRILKAMQFSQVKIIGHPTARLINKREEIDADWDAIFKEAVKKNIALEINSHPDRLDLPDTMVRSAILHGCKMVIDTDAHAADQMDNMRYGVSVARRGWATKNDIINTQSVTEFEKWIFS